MRVAEGIDQRPSGLYRARVYDTRTRRHVSKSFASVAEAKRWRNLARADLARRHRTASPNRTLHDAALEWITGAEAGTIRNRRGEPYEREALRRYRSHLERLVLPRFGQAKVGDLERRHVQRWIDELAAEGRSATDRRNITKPLAAIYRRLVEDGVAAQNPALGLRIEKARTRQDRFEDPDDAEMRVPALDELDDLLGALEPHPRVVFAVAMFAGLRMGEMRALDWGAVEPEVIRVDWQWPRRLPKGGRRRVVPLLEPLRGELERWRRATGRSQGLVLGSTPRSPFTQRWIQKSADESWGEAGLLRLTPHHARHIFSSMLAAAGVPEDDISRWMGQRSGAVRLLYTHETPGAQARARERIGKLLA